MTCIFCRLERQWPLGDPLQALQYPMNRYPIRSFKGSLFASSVLSQSSSCCLSQPCLNGLPLNSALGGVLFSAMPFSLNPYVYRPLLRRGGLWLCYPLLSHPAACRVEIFSPAARPSKPTPQFLRVRRHQDDITGLASEGNESV